MDEGTSAQTQNATYDEPQGTMGGAIGRPLNDLQISSVDQALGALDGELHNAASAFGELVKKITPILRLEPEGDGKQDTVGRDHPVNLANKIEERVGMARDLRMTIHKISKLIDL